MSRVVNRPGRVPSLAMLPLLSKFSKIAARMLPSLPKAALYLSAFFVLVNINSFPFIWHCKSPQSPPQRTRWSLRYSIDTDKIFRHIWIIRIRLLLYKLTLIRKPSEVRKELEAAWLEKLIPIGSGTCSFLFYIPGRASYALASDPWGCGTVIKKLAGPDESDYNLHLSNSSYPKVRLQHSSVLAAERPFSVRSSMKPV